MTVAAMFHMARSEAYLRLQRQRIWLVYKLVSRDSIRRPDIHLSKGLLILDIDVGEDLFESTRAETSPPAAPQLKPSVLRMTFCSFRLLPAHTRVTGMLTTGNFA